MSWDDTSARAALRSLFDAAVASADPRKVLARNLPPKPKGRCIVIGLGKSAAAMAAALEEAWPDVDLTGVVVTGYGHAVPTRTIEVMEASHPEPDANSETAAWRLLELVRALSRDDLVIALISGGGSALCEAPAPGLTLADIRDMNLQLLRCKAPISEINTVRKHVSAIKGGRLAAAASPARVVALAISDVPGDDPAVIASGPTVPDPTTFADARAVVERYQINSRAIEERLKHARSEDETPKPGSLPNASFQLIATPMMALKEASDLAHNLGLKSLILGDALEGEAREMGRVLAGIAISARDHGQPIESPAILLTGGESTIDLKISKGPPGTGGRNTEFLLSLAIALNGAPDIWAMSGDTDGIDGMDRVAGAVLTPDSLVRAKANGLDPRAMLDAHDCHTFFDAINDAIRIGPTCTNVNDFRAILIAKGK